MKNSDATTEAPVSLSTKIESQTVRIDDKDYSLRVMTGEQRDSYLTFSAARMNLSEKDGKTEATIKNYSGMHSRLVALTLSDEKGQPVPEDVIQKWPAVTVDALFKMAQKLNGMGVDKPAAEDAAKKD